MGMPNDDYFFSFFSSNNRACGIKYNDKLKQEGISVTDWSFAPSSKLKKAKPWPLNSCQLKKKDSLEEIMGWKGYLDFH